MKTCSHDGRTMTPDKLFACRNVMTVENDQRPSPVGPGNLIRGIYAAIQPSAMEGQIVVKHLDRQPKAASKNDLMAAGSGDPNST